MGTTSDIILLLLGFIVSAISIGTPIFRLGIAVSVLADRVKRIEAILEDERKERLTERRERDIL